MIKSVVFCQCHRSGLSSAQPRPVNDPYRRRNGAELDGPHLGILILLLVAEDVACTHGQTMAKARSIIIDGRWSCMSRVLARAPLGRAACKRERVGTTTKASQLH